MIRVRTIMFTTAIVLATIGIGCSQQGSDGIVLEYDGERMGADHFIAEFLAAYGPDIPSDSLDAAAVTFAHDLLRKKLLEAEARSAAWGDTSGLSAIIATRLRATMADEMRSTIGDTVDVTEDQIAAAYDRENETIELTLVIARDFETLISTRKRLILESDPEKILAALKQQPKDFTVRPQSLLYSKAGLLRGSLDTLDVGDWSEPFTLTEGHAVAHVDTRVPADRESDELGFEAFSQRYAESQQATRVSGYARDVLWPRYSVGIVRENVVVLDSLIAGHVVWLKTAIEEARSAGDRDRFRILQMSTPTPEPDVLLLPLARLDGAPDYRIAEYLQDLRVDFPGARPPGGDLAKLEDDISRKIETWLLATEVRSTGDPAAEPTLSRKLANAEAWEHVQRYYYYEIERSVQVTREDIQKYYDDHISFYEANPQRRVAFFRTTDKAVAEWVLASLNEGLSRDSVAVEGQRRGTDLYYYGGEEWYGTMGYEIDPVLEEMSVGDVRGPATTSTGNHYVLCLLESRAATFEEAISAGLDKTVLQFKRDERLDEVVARLMEKYGGSVSEEAALEAARRLYRS